LGGKTVVGGTDGVSTYDESSTDVFYTHVAAVNYLSAVNSNSRNILFCKNGFGCSNLNAVRLNFEYSRQVILRKTMATKGTTQDVRRQG